MSADVLALLDQRLLDLGGTYGDPEAGDPTVCRPRTRTCDLVTWIGFTERDERQTLALCNRAAVVDRSV